mgnify:CR=1 FL=1
MLQRVRELAVQYNNGTLSASDKASITAEVSQLCAEISRIGSDTKFNGIAVLTGSSSITFQSTTRPCRAASSSMRSEASQP